MKVKIEIDALDEAGVAKQLEIILNQINMAMCCAETKFSYKGSKSVVKITAR